MASRNGLNPKIRGPKGVGYGRALPAAFGFGNGIVTNANGYLSIPAFIGANVTTPISFELWTKISSIFNYSWCGIKFNYSSYNMHFNIDARGGAATHDSGSAITFPTGIYNHIVSFFDPTITDTSKPNIGTIVNAYPGGYDTPGYCPSIALFPTYPVSVMNVCGDVSGTELNPYPMDEFRIYNKVLSLEEISSNYNNGLGSNPSITENLLAWYKFQEFETLDFSRLQDGSDMRLGIRDYSGKNNHAQAISLDTNPTSGTYSLQPF
ncbi:MAG TPA: hypothetical protein VHB54_17975 [Mucilaginibacter sp.]|nr:hypothetical protein [Mucilaginibacter sp.]